MLSISFKARLACLLISLLCCAAAAEDIPVFAPATVTVYRSGPSAIYRIPALLYTHQGSVLALAEQRKGNTGDTGNIGVVLRRSTDSGKSWSPITTVAAIEGRTIGNPCIVQERESGAIFLFVTGNLATDTESAINKGTSREGRRIYITISKDDGVSWSVLQDITLQVKGSAMRWYATGPGAGTQLADGRLVIPCDHTSLTADKKIEYRSHIIYSEDQGYTWHLGGSAPPVTNECQVVELQEGHLLLSSRNFSGSGTRAFSRSKNSGLEWGPLSFSPEIPDPMCQGGLIRLVTEGPTTGRLLASGPSSRTERVGMLLHVTSDADRKWQMLEQLYSGPAGYSCLAQFGHAGVGCLYERGVKVSYEEIVLSFIEMAKFSRN